MDYQRPVEWFIHRIGRKIYRDKLKCQCEECQATEILILDRNHAEYIHTCHNEMGIKYYDEPKEGE